MGVRTQTNFTAGILRRELASIHYIHKPSHNAALALETLILQMKNSEQVYILNLYCDTSYCIVCQVDDMILCDGNYGMFACGMDSVHTREPERNRVTI